MEQDHDHVEQTDQLMSWNILKWDLKSMEFSIHCDLGLYCYMTYSEHVYY